MLNSIFKTNDDFAIFIARLALGIVILHHGLQKLLGLFGGPGFSGTLNFFVQQGVPSIIAFLIIICESFGSIGLILGFLSRLAALGITLIMLGAILLVHLPNGFFMNWFGAQQGEGFEFHILAIGLGIVILIKGAGKWSIDRSLVKD